MKILFTICGRAGSKGFKNKNLKQMNGIPLVYYTLAAIKAYKDKYPEHKISVVLNTDSQELISLVEKQSMIKDVLYVERKEDLAGDKVAKVDVIRDTYLAAKAEEMFDLVIDLDITSPLRRVRDIKAIIDSLTLEDKGYDLVFSVVEARRSPYFNMVERKEDGYYRKVCNSDFTARQQTPKSYELNASIYGYKPAFLESEITKTILDYNCGIVLMPDYLVLDIDSEEDFKMMEFLASYFLKYDDLLKEIFELAQNSNQ